MQIHGFAPIATSHATVLILGTMPGKASLLAQQYYAHPRNAFWPIVGQVLGFDAQLPYAQRTAALCARGVALWNVLQSCTRASSLDADIDSASVVPNDFAAFFAAHPRIQAVCFNGGAAARLYRRHVDLPAFAQLHLRHHLQLPSTSPAHAAMPLSAKAQEWNSITKLALSA